MRGVVDRRGDGVDESLIGVGGEVHSNRGFWSDAAAHLDIEHHLAVGTVRGSGGVAATVHRDGDHSGWHDVEHREVRGEIRWPEPSAELDQRDALPFPREPGGKVVRGSDLRRRVLRGRVRPGPELWPRLRSFVQPEDTDDHPGELARDEQLTRPGPVLETGVIAIEGK